MSFTDLSVYTMSASPGSNWTFLRVVTEQGTVGWGEMTLRAHEAVLRAIVDDLRQQLIGKPLVSAAPLRRAFPSIPSGRAGNAVVSALDQALRDIEAQHLGCGIYAMQGGQERRRLPGYATVNRRIRSRTPEGFAEGTGAAAKAGFTGVKIMPFDRIRPETCDTDEGRREIRTAIDRVFAVRDAVGRSVDLMVDCHWRLDRVAAEDFLDALRPVGLFWLEAPTPENAQWLETLADLRRKANAQGVLLAGAENALGAAGFHQFLVYPVYDVVMPDIKYCGGYAEFQRINEVAFKYGVSVSPHNPSGPIAHAHTLHACTALGLDIRIEQQFEESNLFWSAVEGEDTGFDRGGFQAPAGPGLGVRLRDDFLTNTYEQVPLNFADPSFT